MMALTVTWGGTLGGQLRVHHEGTKGAVMDFDALSHAVIGAALEVHKALGPGLLESAYARCLAIELEGRSIRFRREVPIPLLYRGIPVDAAYRADFIVERHLIVEVKSVTKLEGIHSAQLLTYLKLTGIKTGLLINFNTQSLRNGVIRVVH
jgi:GxxExxY protein